MNFNAKKIAVNGLSIAIVCLSTMVIQIPIPLGYCHLGNCCIILISFLFSWETGLIAGGVGSMLADVLTGFPMWAFPTLIIKSLMGYAIAVIAKKKGEKGKMTSPKTAVASVVGIIIMVVGYDVAGSILYGSVATGLAQTPGLVMEGIVGIVLFYALGFVLEKAGIQKLVAMIEK